MTRSLTSATAPESVARRCPRCGQVSAGSSTLCRFCLQALGDAPEVPAARPVARRTAVTRLLIAALIAVVVAVPLAVRYVGTAGRPLPPSSTNRSAPAADLARTRATASTPDLDAPVAWRHALPAALSARLVSDGVRVYAPLVDRRLLAIALSDGQTVWSVSFASQLEHAPAVVGDLLYVGTRDGRVIAIEAASGQTRWTQSPGVWVSQTPVVLDGAVYAVSGPCVQAFDAERGSVLWTQELDSNIAAAPAITGRGIAIATGSSLFIFDRQTGSQSYRLTGPFLPNIAAHQGLVVGVSRRIVLAVDETSRSPWWEPLRTVWFYFDLVGLAPRVPVPESRWTAVHRSVPPSQPGEPSTYPAPFQPVLAATRLFLAWPRGAIRALDLQSGETAWERTGAPMTARPMLTGGGLLLAEGDALVLIDPGTGLERSRHAVTGGSVTDLVLTDHAVLLAAGQEIQLLRR